MTAVLFLFHQMKEELIGNVLYSCIEEKNRDYEQFTPGVAMGYIVAGDVQFFTASGMVKHGAGSIGLAKKDLLIKTTKIPPPGRQFKSISMRFPPDVLQEYAAAHHIRVTKPYTGSGLVALEGNAFIRGFFHSLLPYFEEGQSLPESLLQLKTQEAIELLLRHDPALKELLFDFNSPYKVDLAEYMGRHFMFNVPLEKFARLTGRSLAAFKRDFGQRFGMAPGKWLQQRRLEEAHRLLQAEGRKPSDVYLDVGFENFSHFSFAFKKVYGRPPSAMARG
jgi:AraC-like DNA-binding protein